MRDCRLPPPYRPLYRQCPRKPEFPFCLPSAWIRRSTRLREHGNFCSITIRRAKPPPTTRLHSMRLRNVSRRLGVAKRKRLEPISLEELENNPCASGLDKVLRFEVPAIRDFPALTPRSANGSDTGVGTSLVSTGVITSVDLLTGSPLTEAARQTTPAETSRVLTPVTSA